MNVINLAQTLIQQASITPDDANCQHLIADLLQQYGFNIRYLNYGKVKNLWATHGTTPPYLVFAGHTDVVPPGDLSAWTIPPFAGIIDDQAYLHGRGAVDMKGSLAAMVLAACTYVKNNPNHNGTIGFLLTSDEEGDAIDGTNKAIEQLLKENIKFDYCVIGEPTCCQTIGDFIQIGRRGSIVANIKLQGVQGHVAYPDQLKNPIYAALPVLNTLKDTVWDHGTADFPATNMQISNLTAISPASNVTAHELQCTLAIRFCPASSSEYIQNIVNTAFTTQALPVQISWQIHGQPFISQPGKLLAATRQAIKEVTGIISSTTTIGGTSDGRFIAKMGGELLEIGPTITLMHQVNEKIACSELITLEKIYLTILQNTL